MEEIVENQMELEELEMTLKIGEKEMERLNKELEDKMKNISIDERNDKEISMLEKSLQVTKMYLLEGR